MGEMKMKKRIVMLTTLIALLALVIAGGTMAWFTSTATSGDNKFTTGTVVIGVDENGFTDVTNWNPGDTSVKNVDITIASTKKTYLRADITSTWEGALDLGNVTLNFANIEGLTNWLFFDGTAVPATMTAAAFEAKLAATGNGFIYYKNIVTSANSPVQLLESVSLAGEGTDDRYQGKTFTLKVDAQGVQASHEAFLGVWDIAGITGTTNMIPVAGMVEWTN